MANGEDKLQKKILVSERAFVQRINRKLAKEEKVLKKCRPGRSQQELGDYYIVYNRTNTIVAQHFDKY